MAEIDCVIVNGQCLASLQNDMLLSKTACDGLMLGYTQQQEEETIDDHQDGTQKNIRTVAVVTGLLTNSTSHVLIDEVGEVHDQILRDMFGQLQRQQILGWFVCREGKMQPSMREQAGCVYMIRCLQSMQVMSGKQRLVFAIMQKQTEGIGGTISLHHRFFQVNRKPRSFPVTTPLLTPVSTRILSGVPQSSPPQDDQNYFLDEFGHGSYDAIGLQLEDGCSATPLTSTMKKLETTQQRIYEVAELQTQFFESKFNKVTELLRKELDNLQLESKTLQEARKQVEAVRKEMYYD